MTTDELLEKWIKLELETETGKVVGVYFAPDDWVPNGDDPPQELDEIVYLAPSGLMQVSFELGAKKEIDGVPGADPTLGTGEALAWYTKDVFENGTRINLGIFVRSVGGSAGVGTGSYELYLPEEIEPAEDKYSGHANLWMAGGGISEFDGSVKWTLRNVDKGPKLIFTFNGVEWDGSNPKRYADFKLRASIEYYL